MEHNIILYAQCRQSRTRYCIDSQGLLRPEHHPDRKQRVILGDVGDAALRALGAREPPVVTMNSRFDEQSWKIHVKGANVELQMVSQSYWARGFFSRSFVLEIKIKGFLKQIQRFVFDLTIMLGQPAPWIISMPWL